MRDIKIWTFEEEIQTIVYKFFITIDWMLCEWTVTTKIIDGNTSCWEHRLHWYTPGHPNLSDEEEDDLIQLMFDTI